MVEFEKLSVSQESDLEFKPLTEGLGFQPFSDGLPYAPLSKSARGAAISTTGAGATVAGPHRYSMPKTQKPHPQTLRPQPQEQDLQTSVLPQDAPPLTRAQAGIPRVDVPIVSSSHSTQARVRGGPMPSVSTPQMRTTDALSPIAPQSSLMTSTVGSDPASSLDQVVDKESLPEHYLSKRVLAYSIDLGFNSLLLGTVLSVTVWFYEVDTQILLHSSMLAVVALVLFSMNWILVLLQEVVFKTSLGKYFFRLMLTGGRGQILIRGLLFPFSCAPLGLGLLWACFDPNKACLHDRLLGSQPLEMKNFY